MSIESGQVIITCDRCVARLVHDPSPLPTSSEIPAWTSQDAMLFASSAGWSFDHKDGILWVYCPSCASSMAATEFNREEQGKIVVVKKEAKRDEWEGFGSFLTDTPDEERYASLRLRREQRKVKGKGGS